MCRCECVCVNVIVSVNVGDNVIECDSVSTIVEIAVLIETIDAEDVCVWKTEFVYDITSVSESVADADCTSWFKLAEAPICRSGRDANDFVQASEHAFVIDEDDKGECEYEYEYICKLFDLICEYVLSLLQLENDE